MAKTIRSCSQANLDTVRKNANARQTQLPLDDEQDLCHIEARFISHGIGQDSLGSIQYVARLFEGHCFTKLPKKHRLSHNSSHIEQKSRKYKSVWVPSERTQELQLVCAGYRMIHL